jgi:hypothetical protein
MRGFSSACLVFATPDIGRSLNPDRGIAVQSRPFLQAGFVMADTDRHGGNSFALSFVINPK